MKVRAKRLGWDEELSDEQTWDMDPYEHDSDDLEGELQEFTVPATSDHREIKVALVGGQEADPETVVEVGDGDED